MLLLHATALDTTVGLAQQQQQAVLLLLCRIESFTQDRLIVL
jgi:hypothetical protein